MSDEINNQNGSDPLDDVVFEPMSEDGENEQSPKDIIQKLRQKLSEAQKEKAQNLEGWQRMKADFVNAKAQTEEDVRRGIQREKEKLIGDILPIVDNFLLAQADETSWAKLPDSWKQGVNQILNQLLSVLRKHGCEPFGKIGDEFDPNFHEALGSEGSGGDKMLIGKIIERGYILDNKVIKPAKVIINNS